MLHRVAIVATTRTTRLFAGAVASALVIMATPGVASAAGGDAASGDGPGTGAFVAGIGLLGWWLVVGAVLFFRARNNRRRARPALDGGDGDGNIA